MEHPVALLGRQSGRIDTQRTDHTFQLLHSLVLQCRLERAEQRSHLVVRLQHLEDGLVALVQEREDVRHIRVFPQPVGRFHDVATFTVSHDARRFPELCLRVLPLLRVQHVAVLIVRFLLVVHEEVDAGGEEIHRRGLEKLVRTSATFFLPFLQ